MKWEYLDDEVLNVYKNEALWKDDAFYISFLEHLTAQPENHKAISFARKMVAVRQKYIVAKTFGENGSVTVRIKPQWSNLWYRLLRYWPTYHGPRNEV